MDRPASNPNEQLAAVAFTRQSAVFDKQYANNTIVQYKRKRVRAVLQQYLPPASCILELNAGTGDDAIFLAGQGHYVHATDIAAGMQQQLRKKTAAAGMHHRISSELCSYTALHTLSDQGPYDCIFSNFAGLNCTGELEKVLDSFEALLKPGGIVVLVVLSKFCLWETAMVFKGKWKTAMRRFFSSKGRKANIDGAAFTCWYYSPKFIAKRLQQQFDVLSTEGLCTIVPPSYIENFAEKHPAMFSFLCRWENRLKTAWPWRLTGDYYIISLRKK